MSATVAYLDASAAVKLIVSEPGQDVLAARLQACPSWISSEVLSVELACAARRHGGPGLIGRAERLLAAVDLVPLSTAIRRRAGEAFVPAQRALDAIHLATLISLDLHDGVTLFSYDHEQLEAARRLGVRCASPA